MVFDRLYGNRELKKRLVSGFGSGKVSHCYLITGPAGSGKATLARLMAQAFQCDTACGICQSCRKVQQNIHPDVITVDDPDKKTVGVETIRDLLADACISPNEGKRKIYIIPRAQDMTVPAQNTLLKLIEEPPAHAVFLLLTDHAASLLPTVRSRSVELRMEPLRPEEAHGELKRRFPDRSDADLNSALQRAGGYLGQAAALLEQNDRDPAVSAILTAYGEADRFALAQALISMDKLPRDRFLAALTQLRLGFADALFSRSGMPCAEDSRILSRRRTAQDLANAVKLTETAINDCNANIGAGHICGWLAVRL